MLKILPFPPFPQNDETFFRQFITGFVQIWEEQLNLNFTDPPDWKDIKADQGPHISRLPDELLPAIGKFLIIGKDRFQNDVSASGSTRIHFICHIQQSNIIFSSHFFFVFVPQKPQTSTELIDTTLLVRCLIVMCRHFDNINTVANYEYISSVVTISITIVISVSAIYLSLNSLLHFYHFGLFFHFISFQVIQKPAQTDARGN